MDNDGNGMDCAKLAVALVLAADDELRADELRLMEAHLAGCAACRAQRAIFEQTDRRLVACGEVLDARSRVLARPATFRSKGWLSWQRVRDWRWAAVAFAGLCIVAVWTVNAPGPANFTRQPFSNAELSDGGTEVIRIELPLSPLGNPFADDAQSESVVLADVVVGSDGLARDIRLAN